MHRKNTINVSSVEAFRRRNILYVICAKAGDYRKFFIWSLIRDGKCMRQCVIHEVLSFALCDGRVHEVT